jgi:hypothetical protein
MSDAASQATPFCLRCPGVRLAALDSSAPQQILFFGCPSCRRQYAQKRSGPLTYRWLHPISLALYCVLFSEDPLADAPRVANLLAEKSSPQVEVMISEIELELAQPTQRVRDILDNPQSEEICRQFLAAVANQLRERLAQA